MKKLNNFILALLVLLMIPAILPACSSDSKGPEVPADDFTVNFTLPASIVITNGGEFTFDVVDEKAPLTTDIFLLEGSTGTLIPCTITASSAKNFTVRFNKNVVEGSYRVSIRRGERKKTYGQFNVKVVKSIIEPLPGNNVYGVVQTADGPVAGVVVSDGVVVTTTNAQGVYNLNSDKKYGYVFISVPSGYEAESNGVLPKMYTHLSEDKDLVERCDFNLTKVNGQDNYTVFFLGDMHLANRTNDKNQFKEFMADLNTTRSGISGKAYGITLGDMTWDLYWYDNKFQFPQYLELINSGVKGLQIYHTMGNHDNDMKTYNDFDAEVAYRHDIAPNFYSFNIGKFHYVVLDDIDCSAYDGTSSRNYSKSVSEDQLRWLALDMAHVDKSTPVIVTAHAPFFRPNYALTWIYDHAQSNTDKMLSILDGYDVTLVTGHTHQCFNVPSNISLINGRKVKEHNVGAVCASWWWSGNLTPGVHLCTDGTPGGYAVWEIQGTNVTNKYYKGTKRSADYQFHSYDLNKVSFSRADVPNMSTTSTSVQAAWDKYCAAYPANSKNEILLNVWNWNPSWTVTVTTEGGVNLPVTRVWAYDPMHIKALSVPRFNKSLTSTPSFITELFNHFFKATAPDADTDVIITVKDEYGHTWTEKMERPKALTTSAYISTNI